MGSSGAGAGGASTSMSAGASRAVHGRSLPLAPARHAHCQASHLLCLQHAMRPALPHTACECCRMPDAYRAKRAFEGCTACVAWRLLTRGTGQVGSAASHSMRRSQCLTTGGRVPERTEARAIPAVAPRAVCEHRAPLAMVVAARRPPRAAGAGPRQRAALLPRMAARRCGAEPPQPRPRAGASLRRRATQRLQLVLRLCRSTAMVCRLHARRIRQGLSRNGMCHWEGASICPQTLFCAYYDSSMKSNHNVLFVMLQPSGEQLGAHRRRRHRHRRSRRRRRRRPRRAPAPGRPPRAPPARSRAAAARPSGRPAPGCAGAAAARAPRCTHGYH